MNNDKEIMGLKVTKKDLLEQTYRLREANLRLWAAVDKAGLDIERLESELAVKTGVVKYLESKLGL